MTTTLPPHEKVRILLVALTATLVGTCLTLMALNQLLVPITLTYRALRRYLDHNRLPELPTKYTDEAGVLMADTTYVIARLDEAMHQLANFDSTTALPNRNLFVTNIDQAIEDSIGEQSDIVVLSVEVLGLDGIASALGQSSLSTALVTVAQRLSDGSLDGHLVARTGDATFAILASSHTESKNLEALAKRMLEAVNKPVVLDHSSFPLKGAVGIAVHPNDGASGDELLAASESALLTAKQSPGMAFGYFSAAANQVLRDRFQLEVDLHHALDEDELELVYQPIVDTRTNNVIGAEALLRWNRRGGQLVNPSTFIPIAEATGLIDEMGKWVLQRACSDLEVLRQTNPHFDHVSINLSPLQLKNDNFVTVVSDVLTQCKVDPKSVQLEVTESAFMENGSVAVTILRQIRALGIKIALDDFGTGYSSLSHLKQLPIDVIKVDQTFVNGLPSDEDDLAIVQTIIALAKNLKIELVAEGVESAEQVRLLKSIDCPAMQGYFFGRPVPAPGIGLIELQLA